MYGCVEDTCGTRGGLLLAFDDVLWLLCAAHGDAAGHKADGGAVVSRRLAALAPAPSLFIITVSKDAIQAILLSLLPLLPLVAVEVLATYPLTTCTGSAIEV